MDPRIKHHGSVVRLLVAFMLALLLLPNVATAASAPATAPDPLGTGLGSSQKAFEAKYGKPTSTKGAKDFAKGDQYAISGYKSVFVYWHNGYAAHITLNAKSGWSEQKAVDIATRFLPTDTKESSQATARADGSVLALGHSAALAKRFSAGTYTTYKVGGRQGDLRALFLPAASGGTTAATVDIAIGTGKELKATTTTTNASTPPATKTTQGSTDKQTYLTTVRTNVTALQKSVDDFNTIIAKGSSMTDAEYQQLITILTSWIVAPADAKDLKAPAGYEELQSAYEAAANDLSGAAIDLTNYLSNGGQDQTLITSAKDKLTSAQSELQQCDQLLTAAGV